MVSDQKKQIGFIGEIENDKQDGRTIVQGFDRVAAINTARNCNLHADTWIPERRALWANGTIRRSAVSVASNIAEGQGRLTTGEFRQFLGISRGSNFELQTQLEFAKALGIGDIKLISEAEGPSHEVGKMIYSLLENLKS